MDKFIKDKNIMSGKGEWDESKHPRDEEGKFTKKRTGTLIRHKAKNNHVVKRKSITPSLGEQVDSVLNGNYKDTHITILEETPEIFRKIGVKNKPFLMTAKHVYLVINEKGKYAGVRENYHNLGKETFLQIPQLLQSPIMVFKNHNMANEIIAIVNAVDKDKNPVIVPIKIDAKGSKNYILIDANLIKSIYGKNNLQNYINKNVRPEDILLIQNKKIRSLNSD